MSVYVRFLSMIAASTLVMYGLMYLNSYELRHIYFSETRLYMALVMGASMAFVMLGFMWKMHKNVKANVAILVGSAAVFGVALWLVRSQATVEDASWMRAMIPHHSIAILTSTRANISDKRVRKLADTVIETQRREIEEMRGLLDDLSRRQ